MYFNRYFAVNLVINEVVELDEMICVYFLCEVYFGSRAACSALDELAADYWRLSRKFDRLFLAASVMLKLLAAVTAAVAPASLKKSLRLISIELPLLR